MCLNGRILRMNYILDTNIIIRYPEILGKTFDGVKFYISEGVLEELNLVNAQALRSVIENTDNKNFILQGKKEISRLGIQTKPGQTLRIPDFQILNYAKYITDLEGNSSYLVTDDRIMRVNAEDNGIQSISLKELKEKLPNKSQLISSAKHEVDEIKSSNNKRLILGFIFGVVVTLIGFFTYSKIELIVNTINVWGTILLIIVSGIALFIFREKQRLAYGIAELFAGLLAVILLFPSNFEYSTIHFNLNFGLKIFGSLYIMVRGQDNILKSISGTKLGGIIESKLGRKTAYNNL